MSFSVTLKNIQQAWWFIGLFLLFFPLMVSLGFWQLSRAEEKRQLLAVYQVQRELPAISLHELAEGTEKHYRSVIVTGHFDTEHYWLLDNRSYEGQSGYEVLMPLMTEQHLILVNRGWVAAPAQRDQLPKFATPASAVSVQGLLYRKEANAVFKHSKSDLDVDWPKRVLQVEPNGAGQALNSKLYPLLLRLEANSEAALTVNWQPVVSGPEKHMGYAIQWFAMAATLLLLFVWVFYKKVCYFDANNKDKDLDIDIKE